MRTERALNIPVNKIQILPHNETLHRTPHISCSKYTLKLTHSKVEFQTFSGGKPPDPRFKGGEGEGGGKEEGEGRGRGEGGGGEGKGGEGRKEGMEDRTPHNKFLDPPCRCNVM